MNSQEKKARNGGFATRLIINGREETRKDLIDDINLNEACIRKLVLSEYALILMECTKYSNA